MATAAFEQQQMTAFAPSPAGFSPLSKWLDAFRLHLDTLGLAKRTIQNKESGIRVIRAALGGKPICTVRTYDLAQVVRAEVAAGRQQNARFLAGLIREIFCEAACAGWIDHNPALSLSRPRAPVSRPRLTWEQWRDIHFAARTGATWLPLALELTLATGQRRSDIAAMRYDHIRGNYLHVDQGKTGARVAISLDLRLSILGRSLGDLIESSRDIDSEHIIHHGRSAQTPGGRVSRFALTKQFAMARDRAIGTQPNPVTFHEQRSLAARLYDRQGLDPQNLLGHKRRATTDTYRDSRGVEWVMVNA